MSSYQEFRGDSGRRKKDQAGRADPTPIKSIEDIPPGAAPQDIFRLNVEVVRITERETNAGDPFWFVKCEDEEMLRFDVVVWETQMARLRLQEGTTVTLDLRNRKAGYSAYPLA